MKLLVVTQAIDTQDAALGFFVRWVETLAPHFERIEVICLKKGLYTLPPNVRVHSLGKELSRPVFGSLTYAFRFVSLAWQLRHEYGAVFVHMNQEYVLIAGWVWKLIRTPIYLWRNHYAGSLVTNVAAAFCTKIFCTSRHSYTARFDQTVLMPVGVDLARFKESAHVSRKDQSVLFLARIAPSKRPDVFVEALGFLRKKSISFSASIYGSPLPEDEAYYQSLKKRAAALGLDDCLVFYPSVAHDQTPRVFAAHRVFVNCSPSGMFDKTMFEAAACDCVVLAVSEDFAGLAGTEFHFSTASDLAEKLERELIKPSGTERFAQLAENESLDTLAERLAAIMKSDVRAIVRQ